MKTKTETVTHPLARALAQGAGGRIPVTILTGFLGAGKTTMLNRLVTRSDMADVAVFINELGDIGIDHHLVERIDDALVILDSGCLCCTVQGDLIAALMRLHGQMARREIAPVQRVVIETTGLADPSPVVRALMEDRQVSARFRCDGVLTVVDATRIRDQLVRHREATAQIAMADRLLLSKCDLAGRVEQEAMIRTLNALNPTAPHVVLDHGACAPADLFSSGLYAVEDAPLSLDDWLGPALTPDKTALLAGGGHAPLPTQGFGQGFGLSHGQGHAPTGLHSGQVRSFVVRFDTAPRWRGLSVVLGEILSKYAGKLLRVKGLVALPGLDVPMALQCVEDVAYAPVKLGAWPSSGPLADGIGRLVIIGENLSEQDEATIRDRLAHLPGDREALRRSAATPGLPTRNWLLERAPFTPQEGLTSEAFLIQPRFLREGGRHG
ncbi:GTP-binding protein [Celeribacter ethanolicus]|uniref:GTP-binding protein n=1 Tax=Celeribacter ethanolicus TaxID=1758178 RepID=A0A291GGR6_9RHOB|nr:GTP-binding protein [Celeribacter ethanolicus]ATG49713.1 GTP-binding protein [Celeribacter ethanolicus]